jgi:hypothetical protein
MSFTTPNDSPVFEPLHHPAQAAHVVVPQAPLGNVANQAGMGAKALLAKKMAKSHNPTFISPTDNLMTPCTQKLSAAKKKHFTKGAKPMGQLFGHPEGNDRNQRPVAGGDSAGEDEKIPLDVDDENPFE